MAWSTLVLKCDNNQRALNNLICIRAVFLNKYLGVHMHEEVG